MYYGYPHYASIITFSVNTWSGRPDSNRHAPASDAGEIKPFLYFPLCPGSNTGVEPVSREPQSLMLTITPKAPCCLRTEADSNHQREALQASALPLELPVHNCGQGRTRICALLNISQVLSPTKLLAHYVCRPGGIRTHSVSMYMFLRHACLASCTTDPFLALNSYIPSTERHPR